MRQSSRKADLHGIAALRHPLDVALHNSPFAIGFPHQDILSAAAKAAALLSVEESLRQIGGEGDR